MVSSRALLPLRVSSRRRRGAGRDALPGLRGQGPLATRSGSENPTLIWHLSSICFAGQRNGHALQQVVIYVRTNQKRPTMSCNQSYWLSPRKLFWRHAKMSRRQKQVVCLGGGSGMPKAVLTGLKRFPVRLTAICAMLDSGGSSGRLRRDYGVLAPGDLRRALLALANTSPLMENLFNYRFELGELQGHSFANLFIVALELVTNNYAQTVDQMRRMLSVDHEVLPATLEKADICATLENGEVIRGETDIDVPKHDGNLKVKDVFLQPEARAFPAALEAIGEADLIVIGPGDLYSTVMQILLTQGMSDAIVQSRAKTVYVCNLMTKHGETNGFTVLDFCREIERYLGGSLDYVLYNSCFPERSRLANYALQHPELLGMVETDETLAGRKYLGRDLLPNDGPIEHDTDKVAEVLISLLDESI